MSRAATATPTDPPLDRTSRRGARDRPPRLPRSAWRAPRLLLLILLLLPACERDLLQPLEIVERQLIVAHRGASGVLHEHTLEAYALAFGMGADVLEPDVVLTADGVPVCAHDLRVSEHSDAAARFPERVDDEGRVAIAELTWEELSTVRLTDPREPALSDLRHASLEQFLQLVDRLEAARGRPVAIMPEAKDPAAHAARGLDLAGALLSALEAHGRHTRESPTWVQCFDGEFLRHLREDRGANVRLMQLVADLPTPEQLDDWAARVDALGPARELIDDPEGQREPGWLVAAAHRRGLLVVPWTFRGAEDEGAMRRFLEDWGVDGLFTDDPDLARAVRDGE